MEEVKTIKAYKGFDKNLRCKEGFSMRLARNTPCQRMSKPDDFKCPMDDGFWSKSPICKSCSQYEEELDGEKCYCMAGKKHKPNYYNKK